MDIKCEISVIIPLYNAQQYISRCLDSLVKQIKSNTEIIVVNDGSKDKSLQICKEYQKKYSFIKIITQENSGCSQARNKGIVTASGKWIAFVDADDYVDDRFIENIYSAMEDKCDCILFGHRIEDIKNNENDFLLKNNENYFYSENKQEVIKKIFTDKALVANEGYNLRSIWAKLFNRNFLLTNDIKFKSDVAIGEDMLFMLEVFDKCKALKTNSNIIYHYYFHNAQSATNQYKPNLEDIIKSYDISITPWLEKNDEFIDYYNFYRLNDIVLYLKFYLFNKNNKNERLENKKIFISLFKEGIYNDIYNKTKKSRLIKNYSLQHRIIFYLSVNGFYDLSYLLVKLKYRS